MTLIASISGIRGTLGGKSGEGLSPADILKFTGAYGNWLINKYPNQRIKIIIGRDARVSGPLVSKMVSSTLQFMGIDVVDAGLAPTPSVGIGVKEYQCHGGIIITASHNPKNWNALKLLNQKGEILNSTEGGEMMTHANIDNIEFVTVDKLGSYTEEENLVEMHIEKVINLDLVDTDAITAAEFTVVVDAVNSVGGIAAPMLLKALGVKNVIELYCEPNGLFPHNPEPLPEHLGTLSEEVVRHNAHVGFAVDPDVDRLAIVCNNGAMFGEEYTLVAVADYVLQQTLGDTVSNLSSTQALKVITQKHGSGYHASAVGEINVVEKMKEVGAVIGGEGNGGVIYPPIHYGRDALTGMALFMSHLAKSRTTSLALKKQYPEYFISKKKIELENGIDTNRILELVSERYNKYEMDKSDGLKIYFDSEWIHLRRSNTEPIIRIYAESDSEVKSEGLATKILQDIGELINFGS